MLQCIVVGALLPWPTASAQIPDYFEDAQLWRYDLNSSDGTCAFYEENTIYVAQDTLLNGYQFKRIGIRGRSWQNSIWGGQGPCSSTVNYFDRTFCFLRQSADSIFIEQGEMVNDGLLVSYNLYVGDTVNHSDGTSEVVHHVDTLQLNGKLRRVFSFDELDQHYLIEGLVNRHSGQTQPIFLNLVGLNIGPQHVICFAENDSTVWVDPYVTTTECDYLINLGVAVNSASFVSPELFPNPASTELHVVVNGSGGYSTVLYDLLGAQVLNKRNSSLIDIKHLSKGSYVVEIRQDGVDRPYRQQVIIAR
ncbi:MAG: T9SS type A sorting domain-containing protein [Flavobacteriales bacterium]